MLQRDPTTLLQQFQQRPLLAILRGIAVGDIKPLAEILIAHDFRFVEVSLTTSNAWQCIELLRGQYANELCTGAGTITTKEEIDKLVALDAPLAVMPHCDPQLIEYAVQHQRLVMPGVATPTEAFSALKAGAHVLKIFPAEQISPLVLKSWRSVLPAHATLMPVGGINADNIAAYHHAGARAFGFAGALYKHGDAMANVDDNAQQLVASWLVATT